MGRIVVTEILGQKKFAVLLTNFTDSAIPKPFTLKQAQDGWQTIIKYWEYDSYDKVSLFGSEIFDWQTYPSTQAAFSKANVTRGDKIAAVKSALGLDTKKFDYFIVIFSEQVGDAWTWGNGSIFEPSVTVMAAGTICHEMTHQFGEPDHSWDYTTRVAGGGPGEYWDQTDIMSARNCWYSGTPVVNSFAGSGPHHCMFWKDKFGWLDGTTVHRLQETDLTQSYDHTSVLYSRNEPVVERLNCIQFRDIWVELDVSTVMPPNVFFDDFDAGLHGSGVAIHQRGTVASGNTVPYVRVPDLLNNPDQKFWNAGTVFTRRSENPPLHPDVHIWVQSIDLSDSSARVNLSCAVLPPLTRHRIVAIRKKHSTAGGKGGFDYVSQVGVLDDKNSVVPINRNLVVDWINRARNSFYVGGDNGLQAEVIVEEHWIKTRPDSDPSNNLLSLPSF